MKTIYEKFIKRVDNKDELLARLDEVFKSSLGEQKIVKVRQDESNKDRYVTLNVIFDPLVYSEKIKNFEKDILFLYDVLPSEKHNSDEQVILNVLNSLCKGFDSNIEIIKTPISLPKAQRENIVYQLYEKVLSFNNTHLSDSDVMIGMKNMLLRFIEVTNRNSKQLGRKSEDQKMIEIFEDKDPMLVIKKFDDSLQRDFKNRFQPAVLEIRLDINTLELGYQRIKNFIKNFDFKSSDGKNLVLMHVIYHFLYFKRRCSIESLYNTMIIRLLMLNKRDEQLNEAKENVDNKYGEYYEDEYAIERVLLLDDVLKILIKSKHKIITSKINKISKVQESKFTVDTLIATIEKIEKVDIVADEEETQLKETLSYLKKQNDIKNLLELAGVGLHYHNEGLTDQVLTEIINLNIKNKDQKNQDYALSEDDVLKILIKHKNKTVISAIKEMILDKRLEEKLEYLAKTLEKLESGDIVHNSEEAVLKQTLSHIKKQEEIKSLFGDIEERLKYPNTDLMVKFLNAMMDNNHKEENEIKKDKIDSYVISTQKAIQSATYKSDETLFLYFGNVELRCFNFIYNYCTSTAEIMKNFKSYKIMDEIKDEGIIEYARDAFWLSDLDEELYDFNILNRIDIITDKNVISANGKVTKDSEESVLTVNSSYEILKRTLSKQNKMYGIKFTNGDMKHLVDKINIKSNIKVLKKLVNEINEESEIRKNNK